MSPEDVIRLLDELGRRLGPAGERVFQLAVQRVVTGSIVTLVVGCLFIILAIGTLFVARTHKRNGGFMAEADAEFLAGVAVLVIVCVIVVGSWTLTDLLNAEYTALRDIMKAIR